MRISVIIPAYNGQDYIRETIQSILNQTYKDFELIVIDDCSTDNTFSIIEAIDDNRIRLYRNETNQGIAATTNRAIEISNGEFIALQDQDDISLPCRLQTQLDYMDKNEEIDVLGGGTAVIDGSGNYLLSWGTPRNNPRLLKAWLLFHYVDFANSSVMIRKCFLEKSGIRYRDNCLGMQDFRFFIEASKVGNISSISEEILYVREHQNRETHNVEKYRGVKRKQLYAELQKYSLIESGYKLNEEEIKVINNVLQEGKTEANGLQQWIMLNSCFANIYKQALEMNVDYIDELLFELKRLLAIVLRNNNVLENGL